MKSIRQLFFGEAVENPIQNGGLNGKSPINEHFSARFEYQRGIQRVYKVATPIARIDGGYHL